MKSTSKFICMLILFTTVISCKTETNKTDYLNKVLNNLEKIESAVYHENREVWQPGDTTVTSAYCRFVKEYDNPSDTTIGASFVSFKCEDTTILEFAYDGKVRALVDHEDKVITIDNFTTRSLPFRPVSPPFFNRTKNIIQYALTTEDSITVDLIDNADHYHFKLTINEDRQVEFFGKACHMPENPYAFGETTSIYEIWINKKDNLPYKVRREMPHETTSTTCSNVEFNKLSIDDFSIYEYFPADYDIKKYGESSGKRKESDLVGKKAPDWVLNDKNEQSVSLSSFKGKVLLIQFTGIGCGPCHASIPTLKTIKEKYDPEKFELVAIETWTRKPHSLQVYSNKNDLNYNLLSATDEVIKDYQTGGAAPVYFILDKQQIVQKVTSGYGKTTTENELMDAIDKLL